jgi:quinone-modifying oxidoreductase, subunit QmoA
MMMERLAADNGPTKGKILRPGDNKEPASLPLSNAPAPVTRITWTTAHISAAWRPSSISPISAAQYPDAKIYVFYIDLRTPGKYENSAPNSLTMPTRPLSKARWRTLSLNAMVASP